MFPNLSKGALFCCLFLLLIAAILLYFGFRFNATHGDGGPNFWLAAVFAAGALVIATIDNSQNTKRIEQEQRRKPPLLSIAPLVLTLDNWAWWIIYLAILGLWVWALTRKAEPGGYIPDFWPVIAICIAAIVTVAFGAGAGITLLLK